jgi:hypothetical protein
MNEATARGWLEGQSFSFIAACGPAMIMSIQKYLDGGTDYDFSSVRDVRSGGENPM